MQIKKEEKVKTRRGKEKRRGRRIYSKSAIYFSQTVMNNELG